MKLTKPRPAPMQSVTIDWNAIKAKVAMLQEVIDQKKVMLPEERRTLLQQRAQALAMPEKIETGEQELIELIVFRLAYEMYGIETAFVREVYPLNDITPLPGVPLCVMGIINVRGQIVSVIDLKKFFGLPEKGLGELNKVIILSNGHMEFGIVADVVEGTQSVAREQILPVPPVITGVGGKFLKGITSGHIVVLDAGSILNDESIIVNEEVN